MFLKQIGKDANKTHTHIEFEKVADDLLMLLVDNDINDQEQVFSYWRLSGSGCNPPLEIGVNNQIGTIKSITIFVDSECFKEFHYPHENILSGNILVDPSIFSKTNDFINIKGDYFVTLKGNKFMCKFNEKCDLKEIVVNKNIEFHIDINDQLMGFAISNLTNIEIKTIKSFM